MKNLILYLYFVHFAIHCFGQKLPFDTFTAEDGLIHSHITAIIEDQKGLLWIGTPFGLNWFDGNRFYEPLLKAHTGQLFITGFYNDLDNNIWVLTFYNGIYKYTNGHFYNFLPEPGLLSSNSNNVFDMLQYDEKRYLIATDKDLFWFDGIDFKPFCFEEENITGPYNILRKLDDGSLLLGVNKGLWYFSFDEGIFKKPRIIFEDLHIANITIHDDTIYIGSDKGLYVYEALQDFPENISQRYFSGNTVHNIAKYKQDLWVVTDRVNKINERGEKTVYDQAQGMPKNVSSIFIDSEGIVWFVTSNGLIRLASENYKFFDLRESPINSMTICMAFDNEHKLWLGNYDGLALIDSLQPRKYSTLGGQKIGYTAWLKRTKNGRLLAGTEAGILEINYRDLLIISDLTTTRAFEDQLGNMWLGTAQGKVYKLDGMKVESIELSDSIADYIDGLVIDKYNNLWIGYRSFGVRKYNLRGNKACLVKEYSVKNGFDDIRIRCSATDQNGNLLFGTRTNGLYIFNPDTDIPWHISTSQGLNGNWVKSIDLNDGDKKIYLATNRGVNILNSMQYSQPEVQELVMSRNQNTESSNYVLSDDDILWIANDAGFIKYDKKSINKENNFPKVFFTQIRVNGEIDSSFVPFSKVSSNLLLPYDNNVIEFEFAGINKTGTGLRYTYFLKGQDKEWNLPTSRNFISYNLPPNNYTFQVKAMNPDGTMSLTPASYNFKISSPFWKTPWFISSVLVLFILGLYFIYRFRIDQIKKTFELRRRISNDLHDDIGSTLSSISILSEMVLQKIKTNTSRNMVLEIKENTMSIMDRMDDIIWSINPKNDKMQGFLIRIKRFAGLVFDAKNIQYSFQIPDELERINLTMAYRQNIYLILKEAINNLAKHSGATSASIEINYDSDFLTVIIVDNGKGFDPDQQFLGNGIHNMRERAERIGAFLKIDSHNGKGTKIILKSKMK